MKITNDIAEHGYDIDKNDYIAHRSFCICGHRADDHGFNGCEGDGGTCACKTFVYDEDITEGSL